MDTFGKKQEVLIKSDSLGRLIIWADVGFNSEIQNIPGVAYVYCPSYKPNEYSIELDPRYDAKVVQKNIVKLIFDQMGCCSHGYRE